MSLVVDHNSVLRATQTLSVSGKQVSVVHELPGPVGQLNEDTTPAPAQVGYGSITVDGEVELDLTDLDWIEIEGEEIKADLTGERIIFAKFLTPNTDQPAITIEPGDTNGFPIGERVLEKKSADFQQRPNSTAVVGPTAKIIKLSSSGEATLQFEIVSAV